MLKMPVWCAATGLFVGAIALAQFVAPAVLEKFSLGPFKDRPPFEPFHPLLQRPPSPSSGSSFSRFEFYPRDAWQTESDMSEHQRLPRQGTPRVQNGPPLSAKPPASLVRQPYLVSHALAQIPPTAAPGTIRALQRELKRVGCYTGNIDGAWGPVSRYAAVMFAQSVDLALTPDKPYEIILARSRQSVGPACHDTISKTNNQTARRTTARRIASAAPSKSADLVARQVSTNGGERPQNRSFSVDGRPPAPANQLSSWRRGPVRDQ